MALILQQPKGEPEYNMKDLQETWNKLMVPTTSPAPVASDDHQDVTDIPPGQ
jgi:hypothetical protein